MVEKRQALQSLPCRVISAHAGVCSTGLLEVTSSGGSRAEGEDSAGHEEQAEVQ